MENNEKNKTVGAEENAEEVINEYITKKQNKIIIKTPYNIDFIDDLKKSIHSKAWNSDQKAWIIDEGELEVAKNLVNKHYFVSSCQNKTIKIRAKKMIKSECRKNLYINKIQVIQARGRDSGAWVCDKVSLLQGNIKSEGSYKNWYITVEKDTILQLNVPSDFVIDDDENWEEI